MRVLVGLGNPGEQYAKTRHNAGFWLLDAVIKQLQASGPKQSHGGELYEARLGNEKVMLFKPMTFMNRSGEPIAELSRYFNIPAQDICIASDEVYVQPGSVRIRKGGGDGGHNGWKSVINQVKPDEFWRIKIGVGLYEQHPEKRLHQPPLDEYVLQPLPSHEHRAVIQAIDNTVPNLIKWLETGELVEETVHH